MELHRRSVEDDESETRFTFDEYIQDPQNYGHVRGLVGSYPLCRDGAGRHGVVMGTLVGHMLSILEKNRQRGQRRACSKWRAALRSVLYGRPLKTSVLAEVYGTKASDHRPGVDEPGAVEVRRGRHRVAAHLWCSGADAGLSRPDGLHPIEARRDHAKALRMIDTHMASLKPGDARFNVLRAAYLAGRLDASREEIAHELGVSPASVRMYISRGRKLWREFVLEGARTCDS